MLIVAIPNGFPYHGCSVKRASFHIQTIDVIGASLMLIPMMLIIVGFEEASNLAPWISANFLAPLLISIPCWLVFLAYERRITLSNSASAEPVLPWRLIQNRVVLGIIW